MPKTTYQEDDKDIADDYGSAAPASAKGDIEVVAKPGAEGYMPPPPKLRYIAGEIGEGKILHQPEIKKPRCTDRNIRIPRKIAIDLKSKKHRPEK